MAPEWHRRERREGKAGVIVDAMKPKLGVPLYIVEFPDGWTAQYSESYLQPK